MQKYAEELKRFENELLNQEEEESHDGELEVVVQSDNDIILATQAIERRGSTFVDNHTRCSPQSTNE